MEHASTQEKSFHACFYGIVLYGIFAEHASGMPIHGWQQLCFFGCFIIAGFSPRHTVLVSIPWERSNLLLRCA